ncbi:MAG: MBL fold metallo-hydrolase [Sporocytophaga sp.]|nr:MBL fold metallo-hydrolase [Sporocytophaga sp.]
MEVKTFHVSNSFIKNQCYLIYSNHAGILVDPSWDYNLIKDFLVEQGIVLKGILLTHAHIDHTDLAQRFAVYYDVQVFMSSTEIEDYGFHCWNLERVFHLQELFIDCFKIIPILTPGHTSGSICYLIDRHLFSGDTVFIEGVGICNAEGSDVNKMFDSVQFLKSYLPEYTLFWPGHSFGQSPGKSLRFLLENNIYLQIESRKIFTDFRMRKKQPDPFSFC